MKHYLLAVMLIFNMTNLSAQNTAYDISDKMSYSYGTGDTVTIRGFDGGGDNVHHVIDYANCRYSLEHKGNSSFKVQGSNVVSIIYTDYCPTAFGCPCPEYGSYPCGGIAKVVVRVPTTYTFYWEINDIYELSKCGAAPSKKAVYTGTITINPKSNTADPKEFQITHFHQLTTNSSFSNRQLLATIPGASTLKVCADGAQASILKFTGGSFNYSQVSLSVPNDIAKYGAFSLITQVADSLVVRYQHPVLLDPSTAFFAFTATLAIPGSIPKNFTIEVQRAPVMMIHGLWADSSSFAKMESDLLSTGFYTNDFTMRVNYKSTNFVSFNQNKTVVPNNITALISKLRAKGIAAGKVDIAGHSMGGILSRLYLQSTDYRQDVHKLITINTPHSGAQMANLLLDATQINLGTRSIAFVACLTIGQIFLNNTLCNGGAINDLRVDSPAIRDDLNGGTLKNNPVPSHAIVTIENPTADIDLNTDNFALMDKTYMAKLLFRDAIEGGFNIIFNPDIEDDIIVSTTSQKGGLTGTATSLIHDQIHMGSPANPEVIMRVKTLLAADPNGGSFSQTGFNPVQLSYQPQWRKFSVGSRKSINSTDANITITSPQRGSYWRPGEAISVSSSSTGFSYIKTVLQYNSDSVYVAERTTPVATYTASIGNSIGLHKIVVIGQTSAGEMITDSSYFYITNSLCNSLQSGDWRSSYVWSCGHEPTLTDVVVINSGHTITVTSNNAQAQRLIYQGGVIRFTSATSKVFVNSN